jgi:hypothetical protein
MSTNAFIYFREYKEKEQSLTHPSERLVQSVSSSITLLDGMMAQITDSDSLEEKITAAFKGTFDFEWIRSPGFLLHHQEIVDGFVRSVTRISVP